MNPTSRLRIRARSVDESRSPRIESSVDFPQPDGPAIETYSPLKISRWMPESACVSTSSVKKTFVTDWSWMRGVDPFFIFVISDCWFLIDDCERWIRVVSSADSATRRCTTRPRLRPIRWLRLREERLSFRIESYL